MPKTTAKPLIKQAVDALAAACDQASSTDEAGFNKYDTSLGHSLAERPYDSWSARQEWAAWKMLRKYQGQLRNMGIQYDAIPKPDDPEDYEVPRRVSLDEAGEYFWIEFPFEWNLKEAVKQNVPGRNFHKEPRPHWTAPTTAETAQALKPIVESYEMELSADADQAMQSLEDAPTHQLTFTDEAIQVAFPYDPLMLSEVKSAPGATWDQENRVWTLPHELESIHLAKRLQDEMGFECDADSLESVYGVRNLDKLLQRFESEVEAAIAASKAEDADLEVPSLNGTLRPFQRAGAKYALDARRCFIADSMGLGKTVQSLATLEKANAYPAIIVCPASLKHNWLKEVRMWLPHLRPYVLAGQTGRIIPAHDADVIILNYDILHHRQEQLVEIDYQAVILDESHKCKNQQAQRTKAAQNLAKQAEYRLALTGTPITNKPYELASQLRILDRLEDLGGWRTFVDRYCAPRQEAGRVKYDGASNLEQLNTKLRSLCYVRRTKEDVLKDLPEKARSDVPIEITNLEEYQQVERDVIDFLKNEVARDEAFRQSIAHLPEDEQRRKINERMSDKEEKARRAERLVQLNTLKRVAAQGKLKPAIDWIKEFLANGEKLVVFAHHREIQRALSEAFPDAAHVLADDSGQARQANVDRFQNEPDCQLMIGSLNAAGVGITLTAASDVVFLELAWTPADHDQAEDRCILEGEPILTDHGWKPVEDIAEGDHVVSHDGYCHRVVDTYSRKAKSASPLRSKDIAEIEVTGWQHPIKVTTDHQVLTTRGWLPAGDLKPRDQIKMPQTTEGPPIPEIPISDDYRCRQTYTTPGHNLFGSYYEKQRVKPPSKQRNGKLTPLPRALSTDEDTLFILGFYIGDGYAYTGHGKGRFVSFCGHDEDHNHLPRCELWSNSLGLSSAYVHDAHSHSCELRIYSAELAFWFQGEMGRTLEYKQVPKWIFASSVKQRREFLEGWVASDGYERFPSRGGQLRREVITASNRLAADVTRLLISIGEKPCVRYGQESGAWTIGWTEGTLPALTVNQVHLRTCNKTERVYDLTVEDAHTFVVGTAVVHNCHRIGQHDSVTSWYLLAEETIDETINALLESKREVVDAATEGASEQAQDDIVSALISDLTGGETM